MMEALPTVALLLMAAAAILQAVFLLLRGERSDPISHFVLLAAALLLLATLVDRSIRISFPAVTNTYESLVFFSAVICLVLFVLRLVMKGPVMRFILFGGTIVALALLMISSSPIAPAAIQPPIPALQSLWLVLHVTFAFIGEAFFTVSFVAAIVCLATMDNSNLLPDARAARAARNADADRVMNSTIGIGYPIFTAGALIFGAIWAEAAWGSWWSWDPKETWALITWLVYTAYLHTRLVRRLRGRVSAILAVAGFVFTVFTYFGVNFLLSGLHSYGRS